MNLSYEDFIINVNLNYTFNSNHKGLCNHMKMYKTILVLFKCLNYVNLKPNKVS